MSRCNFALNRQRREAKKRRSDAPQNASFILHVRCAALKLGHTNQAIVYDDLMTSEIISYLKSDPNEFMNWIDWKKYLHAMLVWKITVFSGPTSYENCRPIFLFRQHIISLRLMLLPLNETEIILLRLHMTSIILQRQHGHFIPPQHHSNHQSFSTVTPFTPSNYSHRHTFHTIKQIPPLHY
jgi:hypothetical protein